MKITQAFATLLLRITLSFGFISAVASRLGFWGKYSSGWKNFVVYTSQVNSFLPKGFASIVAVLSTILEVVLGLLLLIGYQTRFAARGAALLTLLFAVAMSVSSGIKEPLDYSVFVFSAAALVLSTLSPYKWSMDNLTNK